MFVTLEFFFLEERQLLRSMFFVCVLVLKQMAKKQTNNDLNSISALGTLYECSQNVTFLRLQPTQSQSSFKKLSRWGGGGTNSGNPGKGGRHKAVASKSVPRDIFPARARSVLRDPSLPLLNFSVCPP